MTEIFEYGQATLLRADCLTWLGERTERSIHAVVTDPPYGLLEYTAEQKAKLRAGRGGVWRIPPSFDGHLRSPLPRFTVLTKADLQNLQDYFSAWAQALRPRLVPAKQESYGNGVRKTTYVDPEGNEIGFGQVPPVSR